MQQLKYGIEFVIRVVSGGREEQKWQLKLGIGFVIRVVGGGREEQKQLLKFDLGFVIRVVRIRSDNCIIEGTKIKGNGLFSYFALKYLVVLYFSSSKFTHFHFPFFLFYWFIKQAKLGNPSSRIFFFFFFFTLLIDISTVKIEGIFLKVNLARKLCPIQKKKRQEIVYAIICIFF